MNYKGKLMFLNEISWSYLRKLKTRGSGSINYSNRFVNILFVHKIFFYQNFILSEYEVFYLFDFKIAKVLLGL